MKKKASPICPYCNQRAVLADSAVIYNGRSYGNAWICANFPLCDSYVGCHKGTDSPLGCMANKELRDAKSAAHKVFDAIWRKKAVRGVCTPKQARVRGYSWLADMLGMHRGKCHIGWMNVEQCRKVVEICEPYSK